MTIQLKNNKIMTTKWQKAQEWEKDWHGNCVNSLNEELKQLVYAEFMGLKLTPTPKTPYNIDIQGKTILDIGGGAYSLLLKCSNKSEWCVVSDPLMEEYPQWVRDRYKSDSILFNNSSGEANFYPRGEFDEVWIYNVLQHTYDPQRICENALKIGKIVRIFEWIDTFENIGHPQVLEESRLDAWLNGKGQVAYINKNGAMGKGYFGVFKGDSYGK